MKIFLCVIIAFTIQSRLFAQDFDKVYFNSKWVVVSIENATYYRVSGFNSSIPSYDGKVIDYYFNNNQIEMIGQYENGQKNGIFTFYYPDGKTKMIENYCNNNRVGSWKEFYKNGIVKISVIYQDSIEKLIEVNDSLGVSLLKNNKFKYSMLLDNTLNIPYDLGSSENKELITIEGYIDNNLRDGKWKVKKKGLLYASMTYTKGILNKGYFYTYDYSGVKYKNPLKHNLVFPIIVEPTKFYITEHFSLEPGAVLKNNYMLEGLHQYKYHSMKKIKIKSYNDLVQYIEDNFMLKSNKSEKIKIHLTIHNGLITDFLTEHKLSNRSMSDLKLIFETIDGIEFSTENNLTIEINTETL